MSVITLKNFSGGSGNGVSTFIALTDTDPTGYSGNAGKAIIGNAAETGLTFGQAIRTTDTPTFAGIIISAVTSGNVLVADGTKFVGVTPDSGGLVTKAGTQTIPGAKTFSEHVVISTGKEFRLYDADDSNYVGFVAGSLSANKVWTLPTADGTSGQALTTNGSGVLSFSTISGASVGGTITGGTTGSVLFVGSGQVIAQDNANFFWDDSNNRLGIGTSSPEAKIHAVSSAFPVGQFERTTELTSGIVGDYAGGMASGYYLETVTSGNMTDGFGGGLVFGLSDTGFSPSLLSNNFQARIYVQRDGADTNAAIGFYSGVSTNAKLIIRSSGNVGIGTIAPSTLCHVTLENSTTNAVNNIVTISHNSTGTPAAGFGAGLLFTLESSTTVDQSAARFTVAWKVATHASRTVTSKWLASDFNGEREGLCVESDGTQALIGAYGVAAVARPSAYTQTFSTADKTLGAYTADNEGSAYSGIDNLQGGSVYAQVADLNALRTAYENLRAFVEDGIQFMNAMCDDLQSEGWLQ